MHVRVHITQSEFRASGLCTAASQPGGGWKGKSNDEISPPEVNMSPCHACPYLISHAACVSSEMKPVSVHQ